MKVWNENVEDIFSHFEYLNSKRYKKIGDLNLNVLTINGLWVYGEEMYDIFLNKCNEEIYNIFEKLEDYKLYLFANVEMTDKKSRIQRYKKVWKGLQSEFRLDGFNKGSEIEVEFCDKVFFSSIAEFKIEELRLALDIISLNPMMNTIIASKNNLLADNSVSNIFNIAFNKNNPHNFGVDQIDYFSLFVNLGVNDDIIFRCEMAEEDEIAIVYKDNRLRDIFKSENK